MANSITTDTEVVAANAAMDALATALSASQTVDGIRVALITLSNNSAATNAKRFGARRMLEAIDHVLHGIRDLAALAPGLTAILP